MSKTLFVSPQSLPQILHQLVAELVQLEGVHEVLYAGVNVLSSQTAQLGKQPQALLHGEKLGQVVKLGTEAEALDGVRLAALDVEAVDEGASTRALHLTDQYGQGRRLAGAIHAEKAVFDARKMTCLDPTRPDAAERFKQTELTRSTQSAPLQSSGG